MRPSTSTRTRWPAVAVLAMLGACAFGCGDATQAEREGTAASAIVGGEATSEHPEVVALVSRGRAFCTATLIHPSLALTAAHCLDDGEPDGLSLSAEAAPRPLVPIHRSWAHPRYDGTSSAHDVAVLQLATPLTVPVAALGDGEVAAGAPLLAVGVGLWDDGSSGVRRAGRVRLDAITEEAWTLVPDAALPCAGDSGGPIFDASGAVVAVISRGDEACASYARATPLSAVRDDLLSPILERASAMGAPIGGACLWSRQCESGWCSEHAPFGWCTEPCGADSDCGSHGRCEGGQCAPAGGAPGGLGAVCGLDIECAGAFCASPEEGGARVCTRPCVAVGGCEEGFACRASAEGTAACFAPPVGHGCSSAGVPPSSGSTPALLATVAVLALSGVLRRRCPAARPNT